MEADLNQSEHFQAQLDARINTYLRTAGMITATLGFVCAVAIFAIDLTGLAENFQLPGYWSLSGGLAGLLIYLAARAGKIKGNAKYLIFLPFMTMPSLLFIGAEIWLDAGAATYFNGPGVLLYPFLTVLTGFAFDFRLSLTAGVYAAAQFVGIYFLSADQLMLLKHPDKVMLQDLQIAPVAMFKAVLILFNGWLVGQLANFAKGLIFNIIQEEREKEHIGRLFGQYVSEEIKDKIIGEKLELSGEKKQVAVLFSDIRGFTSFTEGRPAEQTVDQLNEYFTAMVGAVTRNGGVVDKFIGDAVMAVFGGILELDNACQSAVMAGRAMQTELQSLNEKWQTAGRPAFRIGIGIHYGEVIQGTLGADDRKEFTVIGDAVNTASRLEGLTKKLDKVLVVSGAAFQRLTPELQQQCSRMGKVQLRGKSELVEVYSF